MVQNTGIRRHTGAGVLRLLAVFALGFGVAVFLVVVAFFGTAALAFDAVFFGGAASVAVFLGRPGDLAPVAFYIEMRLVQKLLTRNCNSVYTLAAAGFLSAAGFSAAVFLASLMVPEEPMFICQIKDWYANGVERKFQHITRAIAIQ